MGALKRWNEGRRREGGGRLGDMDLALILKVEKIVESTNYFTILRISA